MSTTTNELPGNGAAAVTEATRIAAQAARTLHRDRPRLDRGRAHLLR